MVEESGVYAELAKIFADIFERDDIVLSPSLAAKDVAGWDSFKQIELLIASETCFGMTFTSAEVDSMRQLGDLVSIVEARGRMSGG